MNEAARKFVDGHITSMAEDVVAWIENGEYDGRGLEDARNDMVESLETTFPSVLEELVSAGGQDEEYRSSYLVHTSDHAEEITQAFLSRIEKRVEKINSTPNRLPERN